MSVSGLHSVSDMGLFYTRKFRDRQIRIHIPMGKIKRQHNYSYNVFLGRTGHKWNGTIKINLKIVLNI
jgi:hypothetical protein